MFRLNWLELTDWCQHRKRRIDFSPGTNGIVGNNGVGKSNALHGAFTALTGKMAQDTIDENINFEADKTVVACAFAQGDVVGEVSRTFTAKRVEGDPMNRETGRSTAKLTIGEDKPITGVKKVTAALDDLTGLTPRIIEDHIFISQDKLSQLLFQQKADRMKSFLALIPGVERAEPLRVLLQQEMNRFPEIAVAVRLDEMRQQLKELKDGWDILQGEYETIEAARAKIDVEAALKLLATYADAQEAEKKLVPLTTELAEREAAVQELTGRLATTDTALSKMLDTEKALKPEAEAAKAELATMDQNQNVYATRQKTDAELKELLSEIDSAGAPDDCGKPWSELPALQAQRDTLSADVTALRKVLSVLQQGGVCPTCGKQFDDPETEKQDCTARLATMAPQLDDLNGKIARLQQAEQSFKSETAKHLAWVDQATKRLKSLNETLAGLPEVPAPDPKRGNELRLKLGEYDALLSEIRNLEDDSGSLRSSQAASEARVTALQEQCESLAQVVATMPAVEAAKAAEAEKTQHTQLTIDKATAGGQLKAKSEEIQRLTADEERTAKLAEQATAVREYRELLNTVRDTLHRDRLPQEVLFSYIGELDRLCNKFLDMFGNPFAVRIARDMDLQCIFPNGYAANSAGRLSGGQRCVLSVAIRFAINELFAKDMGLLVLDEPTASMDDDNVAYMGELIEQIHQVSRESGVQTIVVTHHKEMKPCFETLIELS